VNILAPGAIETDFRRGARQRGLNAMVASNTALGRAGQPDDIGGAWRCCWRRVRSGSTGSGSSIGRMFL
jgi:NAD(P)-dependent dehydrogenase (short-subunit alcohol dehydrogenase family)